MNVMQIYISIIAKQVIDCAQATVCTGVRQSYVLVV